MSLSAEEVKQLNKLGEHFGSVTKAEMRSRMPRDKGTLSRRLRVKNKEVYGQLDAVSFSFPRYGVFVEMGVFSQGKGGSIKKAELAAMGKLRPQPWFNPAIDRHLPDFADKVEAQFENFVVKVLQNMKIKNTD